MLTTEQIAAERLAVVNEARTWVRTPFHHQGMVKGAGVDCGRLLYAVYRACDVVSEYTLPENPADWFLHSGAGSRDFMLEIITALGDEVAGPPARTPLPGDAVLWRFGRYFSHSGIVVEWPLVLHTFSRRRCGIDDVFNTAILAEIGENVPERGRDRPMKVFIPKRWRQEATQ